VTAGQETSGIDIKYRDEPGYRVSGTVSGIPGSSGPIYSGTGVSLTNVKTGFVEANTSVSANEPNKSFIFYGVPDGEYDVMALRIGGREDGLASSPLRIKVKGSDVTGLGLTLAPLGKITGQVTLDPIPEGLKNPQTRPPDPPLQDTVVITRREGPQPNFSSIFAAPLDDKGKFVLSNLPSGIHRFELGLPSQDWYVREMMLAKPEKPVERSRGRAASQAAGQDLAARGVTIKAGEHVDGLVITIGRGAAYVAGTLAPETDGAKLPPHARICLVPVEPERAADVLSYRQTIIAGDGTFVIANIAPGKYRAVALPGPADDSPEARANQIAWDPVARKQLRQRAESEDVELDLAPRKKVKDFVMKYKPTADAARAGF
jgi:hypothetical protein